MRATGKPPLRFTIRVLLAAMAAFALCCWHRFHWIHQPLGRWS